MRIEAAHDLATLLGGHARLGAGETRAVTTLASDSRLVRPGAAFFARPGLTVDGAAFVEDAVRAGAVAVVRPGPASLRVRGDGVLEVAVTDIAACLRDAAVRFHGDPSASLRVVGVTGTNGKTSVTHFVAAALQAVTGRPCGLLGTLGYGLYGALHTGLHTTPDLLDVQARLAEVRDAGASHAAMEVSSHALDQGRVAGVRYHTGVFTNLSRDHLDYHADMDAYALAKRRLFETAGLEHAVLNLDDAAGRAFREAIAGRVPVLGYTLEDAEGADIRGRLLGMDAGGFHLAVTTPWGEGEIRSRLAGRFNAENLLAALGALGAQGLALAPVLAALSEVAPPPGRMQAFGGGELPLVVVDYAHTPDALATALAALRPQCSGRLWCVFGCGGDRDRGKRPQMGEVAVRLADRVLITDDNPRTEDGERIVADILAGIPGAAPAVQRDRAAAIAMAVADAAPGDVVLVAGKGHEPYQEVGGVRRPFSDADCVRAALALRGGGEA